MNRHELRILYLLLFICGCSAHPSNDQTAATGSSIVADTKALGVTQFVPSMEMTDKQLRVRIDLTWPNRPDIDIPKIIDLGVFDATGEALPAGTATSLHGGFASVAAHAHITRSFDYPEPRNDIRQLRLIFDDIKLIWTVQRNVNDYFDLRPEPMSSQQLQLSGQ